MPASMPVKEFAQLCKEAQAAVDTGNGLKLAEVNQRLGVIGYQVIVKAGKAFIQALNSRAMIETPKKP